MRKEEFCAGVRILIERMATNPEDFAEDDMDLATMRRTKVHKFGAIASKLERIITGQHKAEVLANWAEWHYLTKAEQDALIAAFKHMRRVEFDKRIMERVFDEKFYTRQEEEAEAQYQQQLQFAQQRAQMLQPGSVLTTNGASIVSPLQGGYVLGQHPMQNAAQNTAGQGLWSSIGSALGFGHQ